MAPVVLGRSAMAMGVGSEGGEQFLVAGYVMWEKMK